MPYDLTEGDIITVFSQYGEIVNINLVRDKMTGKQKGYAFICYEDQRSTTLAVDNLNSIKLLNRTLRVDHVMNYKVPEIKGDEDELTKMIKLEGCAPDVKIEKAMKKLKKKEKKEKDGKSDEGVNSKSWKREPGQDSVAEEGIKPEIKVEGDSQAVPTGQCCDSGSGKASKVSLENEDDFEGMSRDGRRSKDSVKSRKNEGRHDRDLKDSDKNSGHHRREDEVDDDKESRHRKRQKYVDDNYKKSPKHRRYDDDDDDDNSESSRPRRSDKDNENRSPKSRRHDSDESRSSKYRRRHDDDDYRSSKNRRDDEGHRRGRSPPRSRRERS